VPETSSAYLDAQIARIETLTAGDWDRLSTLADLRSATAAIAELELDAAQRARLTSEALTAALRLLDGDRSEPDPGILLAGVPFTERDLRFGLEKAYRLRARLTEDAGERIGLVDRANHVRPRTWT